MNTCTVNTGTVLYEKVSLHAGNTMSEKAAEVDQATSFNMCAESARAFLDRLATVPLSQLDAPELVDQCSDVLSYVYGLNESTKSTIDIIHTAWARVRLRYILGRIYVY